jgi:hypothetical protein
MPIRFVCQCGKKLLAKDGQSGKRVRCPDCRRLHTVPAPLQPAWHIDASDENADLAQMAGVIRSGGARVVRLHSQKDLDQDLEVKGSALCRTCRATLDFAGTVFGRAGLGGELAAPVCGKCNIRLWIGYASAEGLGGEVYLYAPSQTRDYSLRSEGTLPCPTFQVDTVRAVRRTISSDARQVSLMAVQTGLLWAVQKRASRNDVRDQARRLLEHSDSTAAADTVTRDLRAALRQEQDPERMVLLAEVLAHLRDRRAGKTVIEAFGRALDAETGTEETERACQDLGLLTILFGNREGFLEAVDAEKVSLESDSRGCSLGAQLTFAEAVRLLQDGRGIDCYEMSVSGLAAPWVYPLVQQSADADQRRESVMGFLKTFFNKGKQGPQGG